MIQLISLHQYMIYRIFYKNLTNKIKHKTAIFKITLQGFNI